MTRSDQFMRDAEKAARMIAPHLDQLANGPTIYDRAHALLSIVEQCRLALDDARFDDLLIQHIAGDNPGMEQALNDILEVV